MELIEKFETKNQYKTKNWDTEHTFKYLFKSDDKVIEIGYFIHFKDNQEVKKVIELSSSYGCPMKCKFCASEVIEDFKLITSKELIEIVDYIFNDNNIEENAKVLLAITGIGDLTFTLKNVISFINDISKKYKNLRFDVSTIKLNSEILKELEQFKNKDLIRNVQITFVSDKEDIRKLIPYMEDRIYSFSNIAELMKNSMLSNFRINYVMIKGVNDNNEMWSKFINNLILIKDKIKVRISKLNETKSSQKYNLKPADISDMEQFSKLLTDNGIANYMFYSSKNDNMNCGQLISEVCTETTSCECENV
ncbi:MAG: radical SAM protein [Oscillospiraceae bacterium]|nr:radical SAM protein [Oscillospiraceae bacterium]